MIGALRVNNWTLLQPRRNVIHISSILICSPNEYNRDQYEAGIEKSVPRITVCYHSASLVMPNGDPRDRFFYPTLTFMIDSYKNSGEKSGVHNSGEQNLKSIQKINMFLKTTIEESEDASRSRFECKCF